MKVRCVRVVTRISEGPDQPYDQSTEHELHFELGDGTHRMMWLDSPGPARFQVGKVYTLNEIADEVEE